MSGNYYDDIEFREIKRKKTRRKKKHYLIRFLFLIFLCAGTALFLRSGFFSVKEISVKGNSYYSDAQVINLSEVKRGENIFWGESVLNMKDKLARDPYFKEVKIKRVLPSKVEIRLDERKQIAAVAYGEEYIVIDSSGTVLRRSGVDPKLTTLYGLTVSRLAEGDALEAEERASLEMTLKLLSAMEKGDIFFKKLDLSKVVIKAYIYDTLIVKGTPKQIIRSLQKGELQKVVNSLMKQDTIRGTISVGDHNYMSFSPSF